MERIQGQQTSDAELVAILVASGAHCVGCIARLAEMPRRRVMTAFRLIEEEWHEPLVDRGECSACRTTTTVYGLRIP